MCATYLDICLIFETTPPLEHIVISAICKIGQTYLQYNAAKNLNGNVLQSFHM